MFAAVLFLSKRHEREVRPSRSYKELGRLDEKKLLSLASIMLHEGCYEKQHSLLRKY